MNFSGIEKVAIIGAGVAGLATAKTLLARGLDCTVYERGERVGGVWADGYVNFGVQVQKELYEFPDWPLPADAQDFTPGPVFQQYLEDFCDHFGVRPHLRLGAKVVSVDRRQDNAPGWTVVTETEDGQARTDYDLVVIAPGLYSETPNIPELPGRELFRGEVLHVSQVKSDRCLEGRRIAVIGYGKSATDVAGEAATVAEDVHLVFREPHWPVPRKLAGILPFKWGMLNRLTATLIPPYVRPSPTARWIHSLGAPLPWIFWRLVELLLRVQFGLGTKIAQGSNLVPSRPVEIDCFGESTMVPRPDLMRLIRSGRIVAHRTWIDRFVPDGLVLRDGDILEVDCVVFGTGWKTEYGLLSASIRQVLQEEEDGFYLYRHVIHPDLPNLAFIGRVSSFLSVATYSIQARWLAELIDGRIALPSRDEMLKEIAQMRDWKRSWMPFSPARAARVLLHMAHYHDELLRDFGADPFRKRGAFAPLKELMAPYQSSDYRDVASGRRG
ncbi:MAG TPA: FAD-dependent oxidoreductase [Geminicoccaceae bacterium]|nr:FAD-dependent oxidoreductase [Geminicoccaceae bacterium]